MFGLSLLSKRERIFSRSFLRGLAVISADFVGFGVPCQEQDCKQLCKRIVYTFYVQSCRFCRVRRPRRTVLFLQRKRRFFVSLLAFVFLLIHHKCSPFSAREGKGACAFYMQKERKINFYFIVRSRVVGDANPYKVGAYLTQKEDFLFYLLVLVFRTPHHRYAEPLPLEKPQWVCAYYELASNKVLRSRFLFNAKREEI